MDDGLACLEAGASTGSGAGAVLFIAEAPLLSEFAVTVVLHLLNDDAVGFDRFGTLLAGASLAKRSTQKVSEK